MSQKTPTKQSTKLPIKGYVTWLSPKSKKKTVDNRPQFDLHIQSEEEKIIKVKGFGEENFQKLQSFSKDKSPVKMELFKNENYDTPVCGYSAIIKAVNAHEVKFKWNEKLKLEESEKEAKNSKEGKISVILSEGDKDTYYTVKGQLYKGDWNEKVTDQRRIKEDNVLFEKKDQHIKITLWNEQIDKVVTGNFYEITHVKLSNYNGDHLTTSPLSIITELSPGKKKSYSIKLCYTR